MSSIFFIVLSSMDFNLNSFLYGFWSLYLFIVRGYSTVHEGSVMWDFFFQHFRSERFLLGLRYRLDKTRATCDTMVTLFVCRISCRTSLVLYSLSLSFVQVICCAAVCVRERQKPFQSFFCSLLVSRIVRFFFIG